MRTSILLFLASTVCVLGANSQVYCGTLDDIKARGILRVGVKADSVPYGFIDPSGELKGVEIDLSRALADRLKVRYEPVAVTTANRIQFLQRGKVDMLVATLADSPERRRVIDMIEPHYSYAGTNILAPKSKHFTSWTELKGQTLCGQQGSTFNKWVEQTYGAMTSTFPTIDEAYAALRSGYCVAFINNDKVLGMAVTNPDWKDYEIPLKSELPQHHAIGVRKGDADGDFGKFLSATLTEWLADGKLISFFSAWKMPVDPHFEEIYAGSKQSVSSK